MRRPPPTAPSTDAARRRARLTIFVTALLDLLGFGMILPILPFYAQRYGASDLEVGVLFASFSAAQLVFSPLLGRLSDRVGRRPVILVSIAGAVVSYLLFAAAESFTLLVVARTLSGVAAANFGIAQAYMADVSAPEERSRAMGLVGAAFGLGFVLGPAFGGLLSLAGHRAVPLGAAALAALNLGLAALWLPESLPPERRRSPGAARWLDWRRLAEVARDTPVFGLMLLLFGTTFCMSLMEGTLALFVQDRFGFGDWQISWLFVYVGLVMVAVQGGLIAPLVRRFGERRVIATGLVAMAAGLFVLGGSWTLPALALAQGLLAFGVGLNNPATLGLLSRLSGESSQGGTLGLSRSFTALARVLGPLAGTWLFAHCGPPWPFWAGGSLLAAGLGFAGFVLTRAVAPTV